MAMFIKSKSAVT